MTEESQNQLKIYIEFDSLDKQLLNESLIKISK